jgi:DNA-binding NtrC family response regulator
LNDAPKEFILLIEDEEIIREQLATLLRDEGYLVLEAEDAAQAYEQLDVGTRLRLVITDIRLPGGDNGAALAKVAAQHQAGLPIIAISGGDAPAKADMPDGFTFLPKPIRAEEFLDAVKASLAGR